MHKLLILAVAGSGFILFAAASNAAEPVSPAGPAASPAPATPPLAAPSQSPPALASPPAGAGRLARGGAFSVSQVPASGTPIILEAGKGTLLRMARPAATVFIANPDVADVQVKSPALIYLSAKAPGETVVYAVDADDNVLLHAPVRVDHDLSRLRQSINSLMPGENIGVNSVQGSLVLSGNVSTAGRAERARTLATTLTADIKGAQIINQMAVATPNQVNLRVKIAEVNRSVLKALGFNWNGRTPGPENPILNPTNFNLLTQNPVTSQQITQQNTFLYGVPLPGSGGARLQATLDALAQEGLITTLAEPNLTATNGQTASFLAGGEFPVPIAVTPPTGTGGTTITIEFKTFGVSLDFTPTIIDANHLNLRIRPEVSQLTSNGAVQISGFTIPALTVRRAETTVELGSGESFALAGLLQNTSSQDVSKIPWIGDIPVIGQLFRSDRFRRDETELVIIVTPYLVKPSAVAMAAPTDGFTPPHDIQRGLNSETYRQGLPGPARGPTAPGGQGLIGPAGFRLD